MKTGTQSGFTVTDLLIGVAAAAILYAIAVPNFSAMMMNNRVTTQSNDFISTLALARSQALKRVSRVTVCRSSTGSSCAGSGNWEQGWIVFADTDNDATVDTGEEIILAQAALDGSNTLRGSTNVASYISYVSSGVTKLNNGSPQAGSLVLCDSRGAGVNARTINISATGRSRIENNAPVSCTP